MTTKPVYKSVAEAYAAYASEDPVYLELTIIPTEIEQFIEHYQAGIPRRRQISESLVPLGAWRTTYGNPGEITLVHLFNSLGEMQEIRETLLADPKHLAHVRANPSRCTMSMRLMKPLAYCPKELKKEGPASLNRRVYMHLAIQCTRAGIDEFVKFYGSGIPHRRKLAEALVPVAGWRTVYGASFEITNLYAYDSMSEMTRVRKILFTDPDNLERIKVNTSPNLPNNWEVGGRMKLMKPLSFSQMK